MKFSFLIVFISFVFQLTAQDINNSYLINKNDSLTKKRKQILLITEASLYTLSLVSLNQLWYADYPRSNFHFINDNQEWLQMDKFGHMMSSYYTGISGIKAYEWAGFSRKNAIWYGGMTGSIFLTIIEILDGTSKEWGASSGDLLANTTGSLLAIGQAIYWKEQKIQLKYSYSPTNWALENPEQLGSNHLERALKDYNGQTYWLTCNLKSIFNIENTNFPNWLSIALGYSGSAMINPYPNETSYRQYLFSLDVDLNKIKTKSAVLNSILHTFGFLKFPFPAFEISNKKLHFHSIYY